jgi:hypothetical protein
MIAPRVYSAGKQASPRGFTLLLAVLVAGILAAVGAAIYNIVSKEVVLSSAGKESQFAFFAADAGVECVLYQDFQRDTFATSTQAASFNCGNAEVSDFVKNYYDPSKGADCPDGSGYACAVDTFSFCYDGNTKNPCTSITFTRHFDATTWETINTSIDSRGHNTGDNSSTLLLERAIRTTY